MFPEGCEIDISLKICKCMSKQNINALQILSRRVMMLEQIWDSSKHVSSIQFQGQIFQCSLSIPETGMHVKLMISL